MSLELPVANCGVALELRHALMDAQHHCHEYGMPIRAYVRHEANVQRDPYRSITSRPTEEKDLTIYAFPVDYQPNELRMEKAGLRERCDVQITTPRKDWLDESLDFDTIDIKRVTFVIQGGLYEVRDKGRVSDMGGQYLYITFGLAKR